MFKRDSSPEKENFLMIYSRSSHPIGVYDFLLSDEYNQSYIKNVLAFPSVIMAVDCNHQIEAHKSASIHHESVSIHDKSPSIRDKVHLSVI